jgi:hypothetical protein
MKIENPKLFLVLLFLKSYKYHILKLNKGL